MKIWTFKVFLINKTTSAIEEWMRGLPTKVQVKIRTRIKYLEITNQWVRPYFDKLSGHIHEIRIVHSNIQYRILGCFGPAVKEFTLLIGAIEKDWKLPKNTTTTAEERYKLISEDRSYTDDFI